MSDLVVLVHGSKDGIDKLVNAFVEQCPHISKAQTKKRLLEIAEKKKHAEGHGSPRWIVKEEVLLLSSVAVDANRPVLKPVEYTPMKVPAPPSSTAKKRIAPSLVTVFSAIAASTTPSAAASTATANANNEASVPSPMKAVATNAAAEEAVEDTAAATATATANNCTSVVATPMKIQEKAENVIDLVEE